MINELKELYAHRELVTQLVIRDLKVRYKNSVLGFFWSLLNPLLQVAIITVVIRMIMRFPIPNYSAYLLIGFIPWMFFQMSLMDSSQVVLEHRDLVKKVYFPREVLPISTVIANLVHFILAMVVFFAYLTFFWLFMDGASPLMPGLALLPVLIVIQLMLLAGLSLIISCLNVFFEDTKYILQALLNVFFYATPVIYLSELVRFQLEKIGHPELFTIYMLSPIATLIDTYRKALLPAFAPFEWGDGMVSSSPISYPMLGVCALISFVVMVAGYAWFNSKKWKFAERA